MIDARADDESVDQAQSEPSSATASPGFDLYDQLRNDILDGRLAPGTVISQVQLAKQMGVSRTPLREAIRRLQQEGLVEADFNRRARVAQVDPSTLEQIFTERIMHETLALGVSLQHMRPSDLDEIDRLSDEMRESKTAGRFDEWDEAHRAFHRQLALRASDHLRSRISLLTQQGARFRPMAENTSDRSWTAWDIDHEKIAQACREGRRRDAIATLARHLARSATSLLGSVAPEYDAIQVRTILEIVAGDVSLDR
ncbi:GntR family transcriptional regulator [Nocardioides sp. REDSEA-S30_B4]|jgi:DNA-binding GntR family transcriptional regulator|uniref:GntR family transcriptional regulator n=1 Tax=Nocardioides sp. REDSEA-S30_B4 TaxID=1811552 RepID=UPI000A61A813|nr:GntR family transcriptional regulator [Nocardioides sp. REDSEA-S30_B4]